MTYFLYLFLKVINSFSYMVQSLNGSPGLNIKSFTYSDIQFDSKYYNLECIKMSQLDKSVFEYKGLYLNIHSLPSKFEQLRELMDDLAAELRIHLNFLLLCEPFSSEYN